MKILELKFEAFGPFTQVVLDLRSGQFGLHLIFGPNEAGKTSALRAIRHLLYGIPHRSSDDFVHPARNLRLGGTLQHSDGQRLAFYRLKRTKNPLVQADGSTPLDPAALNRFLGGVDESLFSSVFGIDHATLVAGGREIARGGGDLGHMLAAGSGLAGFKKLQQQLRDEADDLFKPAGRNQRIAQALSEMREAKTRLREQQLSGERWARHEQALRTAQQRRAELEERRRDLASELSRLQRIKAALPLCGERAELLAALQRERDVVILPDDFGERRRQAQSRRDIAEPEIRRAAESLQALQARLEAITLPAALLAAEQDVEALRDLRAEQRKAQEDRLKRERDKQEKEHAARDLLVSLGKPRDLDAAESLRLRVDEAGVISRLGHRFTELAARRERARQAVLGHGDRLQTLRRELQALGPRLDLSDLTAALKAAHKEGNLEEQRDRLDDQLAPLERDLEAGLRQLPGWEGSVEALERLAVPLPETVSRHEKALQEADAAARELDRAVAAEEQEIRGLEAALREQSLRHEVPSEDDLREARQRRDAGWALVRGAWLEGRDAGPIAPAELAAAFEKAAAEADLLADRLRREAEAVAFRAERLARLQKHQLAADTLRRQRAEAGRRRDQAAAGWANLLASAGLPAQSPAELRAWATLRDGLLTRARQVRGLQDQRSRVERLIRQHADRLAACLAEAAGPSSRAARSLTALIDAADELAARQAALDKRLSRIETQIAEEDDHLAAARLELETAEAELESWRGLWAERVGRIGLGPDATPEQAGDVLAAITRLFQLLDEAAGFRSRIRAIDRDAVRFAAEALALARRVAPDLADRPPEEIADALVDRLRQARDDRQRHAALTERIQTESRCLEDAEQSRAAAMLELEALCRDAGCTAEAELIHAEQRSVQRVRHEAELRRCEGQIRQLSAGAGVEAFAREVAQADPETLSQSIEDLEHALREIQEELEHVNQTIGSETIQLQQMDGSSRAAEANEAIGFALAQLAEDVPRYAVLRLASKLLHQGIERYRERNQGPVMARAGSLFAALTRGSFAGLKVEAGDRDEATVVGVRPGGQGELGIEAMSAGSCDQLYLALRIAYLEHWLHGREPIPFIVDDILHSFDNDRAMAALEVLGDLSRRTQVLFFTHHAHLLELARSCLGKDVLFPQSLPAGIPL